MLIFKILDERATMEARRVVKELFKWGMVSIVTNSMLALALIVLHITIFVFYGEFSANLYPYDLYHVLIISKAFQKRFNTFAFIFESIGLLISIVCLILAVVGSILGIMEDKKTRKTGLFLLLLLTSVVSVHIVINIVVMSLTFVSALTEQNVLLYSGIVLLFIVACQVAIVIVNCVSIILVHRSLQPERHYFRL